MELFIKSTMKEKLYKISYSYWGKDGIYHNVPDSIFFALTLGKAKAEIKRLVATKEIEFHHVEKFSTIKFRIEATLKNKETKELLKVAFDMYTHPKAEKYEVRQDIFKFAGVLETYFELIESNLKAY